MALSKVDPNFLNVSQVGGRRNLIINGDMKVAQRGTSFTPSSSATVYTLDRQTFYHNMGSHTVEQSTDSPAGFTNSLKVTVTSAGTIGANTINQLGIGIEGYDTVGLGWDGKGSAKPATASFWVKTSVAGTYAYRIRLVGVGTIIKEFTVNSANTWEYKTISIPACPYTIPNFQNTLGFFVGWQLDCGTTYQSSANGAWETPDLYGTAGMTNNFGQTLNATFQVTGHQFEVGDTATPFEHRSYGEELALCQRYYWTSYDNVAAGTTGTNGTSLYWVKDGTNSYATFGTTTFPSQMRVAPTCAIYNPTTGAAGSATSDGSNFTAQVYFSRKHTMAGGHAGVSVGNATGINYHMTADAEL